MTIAIDCKACGKEVAFWFGESEKAPTETCECGAKYRLKVKRVN